MIRPTLLFPLALVILTATSPASAALAGPGMIIAKSQQRPVRMGHRLALAGRQVGQQRRLDPQVRTPGAGGRRRRQLLEERELIRRRDDRWHFLDGTGWPIHPAVIHRLPDRLPVAVA